MNALQQLFAVQVGDEWFSIPGCFYVGILNETKVERCEDEGGMAVVTSRTEHVSDTDVWFCGLPGNSGKLPAPNPPTDNDLNKLEAQRRGATTHHLPCAQSVLDRTSTSTVK